MAYSRRQVEDHKTIMNADLYNNLQDGIDEAKNSISEVKDAVKIINNSVATSVLRATVEE